MSEKRKISIFGATGSIGKNTVDVILKHKDMFDVQVVTASSNAETLADIALSLNAERAVIADESHFETLKERLSNHEIKVSSGRNALIEAASISVDVSMMAIVGMAGLEPLMQALESSKYVAIANKEPLVSAGPLVLEKARQHGTVLLPVDSEHNAIFQVFDEKNRVAIDKLILTASGGPFRTWHKDKIAHASVQDALAHPNWVMGQKISIDSATMMNKALEVVEAHYLFSMSADKIEIIVHPESIIHSMVEYNDGSVLAQLGASDMRTPIANVLSYPNRLETSGKKLNLKEISSLRFEELDTEKFPSVPMAYKAIQNGLSYTIGFNAANEIAVDAFLNNRIYFGDIVNSIDHILQSINSHDINNLDNVLEFDKEIRIKTQEYISVTQNKKAT